MLEEVFLDEFVDEDEIGGVGGCAAECEACGDELGGGEGEVRCSVYDCDDFAFWRY